MRGHIFLGTWPIHLGQLHKKRQIRFATMAEHELAQRPHPRFIRLHGGNLSRDVGLERFVVHLGKRRSHDKKRQKNRQRN